VHRNNCKPDLRIHIFVIDEIGENVTNDRTFVKDASHFTLHDGTTMDVDSKMKRGRPDNVEKKTEINARIHT